MEDAHATILDLRALIEESSAEDPDSSTVISYFGVYDGHGGDKVALFAGENVHKIVARQEAFKRKDFEQALKDGFLATDRAILSGAFCHAHAPRKTCTSRTLTLVRRSKVRGRSLGLHSNCRPDHTRQDLRGMQGVVIWTFRQHVLTLFRRMLEIQGPSSASRVAQSPCLRITNPRTSQRSRESRLLAVSSTSVESMETLLCRVP